MTTAILATVDRLTSRFKLLDSLTTWVLARLLPGYQAAARPLAPGYYDLQCGDFCNPLL